MNIEQLLERIEDLSFDGFTSKEKFLQLLESYPKFKEDLRKELSLNSNQEWIKKAQSEKVYFIINDDSWKKVKSNFSSGVRLNFVGIHYIPTISIDIH